MSAITGKRLARLLALVRLVGLVLLVVWVKIDLESHRRWYDYSRARDEMMAATDTETLIPYEEVKRAPLKLPKRQEPRRYVEPKNGDITTCQKPIN